MSDTENPFDDPDVAAAMAEAGIVHKPGMAAELMREIDPLLKAEGIDLDDPSQEVDLDSLNAAMSRAMEQHNLGLFTPVATHREQVVEVLSEFAQALTHKRLHPAEAVLESVQPEPTEHRPAASHVIGTSLGMLDTWYTDAELGDALLEVPLPKWRGPARSIAAKLIKAARSGDAFASLDQLIVRHGGLLVFQAGALAAAGTILTYANRQQLDVPGAAEYLLNFSGARGGATPQAVPGSAFGIAPPPTGGNRGLLAEFEEWLRDGGELSSETQLDLDMFEQVVALADAAMVDLATPDGVGELVDVIADFENGNAAHIAFTTLDTYVHFRLGAEGGVAAWEEIHEELVEALSEVSSDVAELAEAIASASELSERERAEAFGEVRIVQAVAPLLEWLGASRPITATGGLRRADIETVAGMIGVPAVGVAKRPAPADDPLAELPEEGVPFQPPTIYAQSTQDVLQLAAWWAAVEFAGVTTHTATRARPGPAAAEFLESSLPPLAPAQDLISVFIAELLVQELNRDPWVLTVATISLVLERLRAAVLGREYVPPEDVAELQELVGLRATRLMQYVEHAGLIDSTGGLPQVPPALRGAVANAILMVASMLEEHGYLDEDEMGE